MPDFAGAAARAEEIAAQWPCGEMIVKEFPPSPGVHVRES
jgi:hypothetical protein